MKKTILYRLFKIGGIPKKLRPVLESEGMLISDEGIGGWLIMKDFRAPGKRFKYRMEGFSGFLAVTRKRIIAYSYWKAILNLPYDASAPAEIQSRLVNPSQIELSFESSIYHEDWSGMITLRFNTPKAKEFHEILTGITQG